MNTSTKTTRISAVFLSAVLIAGTITALFPSFLIGAQADPYYGMDKDNKKVDKKVSVSSLKCNNINVNVNGLTLDVFPPFLGGGDIAAEAVEPSTDASSFAGNGGNDDGSVINDFRFICINNNNNTVIEQQQPPVPPTPPVSECEECFTSILTPAQQQFVLQNAEQGDTFAEICEFLQENENNPEESQIVLNDIRGIPDITEQQVEELFDCLVDSGVIGPLAS